MSASEFLVEFERRYGEAQQHGLQMNITMLTLQLLEAAQLSEQQENWVLQTCAGDLTQYQTIRRALRGMPQLDSRHQDASAWPMIPDQPAWENPTANAPYNPNPTPNPFQENRLNQAPPEQTPNPSMATSLNENTPDYYPYDDEDNSDSDDDYCSTCPSNEDEDTAAALNTAFAIVRHKKRMFRKHNGGKRGYRKGFRRKKSAWAVDNQRNASDVVPAGWDPKKWLARSKCPG
jgi:hypothetical protein